MIAKIFGAAIAVAGLTTVAFGQTPPSVPAAPAAQSSAATPQPVAAKPARKPSAFKDDPTLDPRDKELDRRIRNICRGC